MSSIALVLAQLLWATFPDAEPLPAACDDVVIPASASRRDAERTRPCAPVVEAARAAPVRTGRQFAVLRQLGELRIRRDAGRVEPAAAGAAPAPAPEASSRCALEAPGAAAVATSACLECHRIHGHPVGLDYAAAYAAAYAGSGSTLRSGDEVVRRGVLLPEGRMECVSCHDGRSPWKSRIALPPGAPVLPAVVAGRAETFPRGNWRLARAESLPRLPAGSAVSPAPLCAACHTMAD
jgi:hypothetical protein